MRLKVEKKFLSLSLILTLSFLLSSCGGRSLYKRNVVDFFKNEKKVSVILIFSKYPTDAWVKPEDVKMGSTIDAESVPGDIDGVGTAVDTIISPGLLIVSVAGPSRESDIDFNKKINGLFNTIFTQENYFVENFFKKLSFPQGITPDFRISSMEELKVGEQNITSGQKMEVEKIEDEDDTIKLVDRCMVINLIISMAGKGGHDKNRRAWSSRIYLEGLAEVYLINDKEAFHRFLKGDYKLKWMTLFSRIEEAPNDQDGKPKLSVIVLFDRSEYHKKKEWLDENGNFFDQQFKSILQNLTLSINQKILNYR